MRKACESWLAYCHAFSVGFAEAFGSRLPEDGFGLDDWAHFCDKPLATYMESGVACESFRTAQAAATLLKYEDPEGDIELDTVSRLAAAGAVDLLFAIHDYTFTPSNGTHPGLAIGTLRRAQQNYQYASIIRKVIAIEGNINDERYYLDVYDEELRAKCLACRPCDNDNFDVRCSFSYAPASPYQKTLSAYRKPSLEDVVLNWADTNYDSEDFVTKMKNDNNINVDVVPVIRQQARNLD